MSRRFVRGLVNGETRGTTWTYPLRVVVVEMPGAPMTSSGMPSPFKSPAASAAPVRVFARPVKRLSPTGGSWVTVAVGSLQSGSPGKGCVCEEEAEPSASPGSGSEQAARASPDRSNANRLFTAISLVEGAPGKGWRLLLTHPGYEH